MLGRPNPYRKPRVAGTLDDLMFDMDKRRCTSFRYHNYQNFITDRPGKMDERYRQKLSWCALDEETGKLDYLTDGLSPTSRRMSTSSVLSREGGGDRDSLLQAWDAMRSNTGTAGDDDAGSITGREESLSTSPTRIKSPALANGGFLSPPPTAQEEGSVRQITPKPNSGRSWVMPRFSIDAEHRPPSVLHEDSAPDGHENSSSPPPPVVPEHSVSVEGGGGGRYGASLSLSPVPNRYRMHCPNRGSIGSVPTRRSPQPVRGTGPQRSSAAMRFNNTGTNGGSNAPSSINTGKADGSAVEARAKQVDEAAPRQSAGVASNESTIPPVDRKVGVPTSGTPPRFASPSKPGDSGSVVSNGTLDTSCGSALDLFEGGGSTKNAPPEAKGENWGTANAALGEGGASSASNEEGKDDAAGDVTSKGLGPGREERDVGEAADTRAPSFGSFKTHESSSCAGASSSRNSLLAAMVRHAKATSGIVPAPLLYASNGSVGSDFPRKSEESTYFSSNASTTTYGALEAPAAIPLFGSGSRLSRLSTESQRPRRRRSGSGSIIVVAAGDPGLSFRPPLVGENKLNHDRARRLGVAEDLEAVISELQRRKSILVWDDGEMTSSLGEELSGGSSPDETSGDLDGNDVGQNGSRRREAFPNRSLSPVREDRGNLEINCKPGRPSAVLNGQSGTDPKPLRVGVRGKVPASTLPQSLSSPSTLPGASEAAKRSGASLGPAKGGARVDAKSTGAREARPCVTPASSARVLEDSRSATPAGPGDEARSKSKVAEGKTREEVGEYKGRMSSSKASPSAKALVAAEGSSALASLPHSSPRGTDANGTAGAASAGSVTATSAASAKEKMLARKNSAIAAEAQAKAGGAQRLQERRRQQRRQQEGREHGEKEEPPRTRAEERGRSKEIGRGRRSSARTVSRGASAPPIGQRDEHIGMGCFGADIVTSADVEASIQAESRAGVPLSGIPTNIGVVPDPDSAGDATASSYPFDGSPSDGVSPSRPRRSSTRKGRYQVKDSFNRLRVWINGGFTSGGRRNGSSTPSPKTPKNGTGPGPGSARGLGLGFGRSNSVTEDRMRRDPPPATGREGFQGADVGNAAAFGRRGRKSPRRGSKSSPVRARSARESSRSAVSGPEANGQPASRKTGLAAAAMMAHDAALKPSEVGESRTSSGIHGVTSSDSVRCLEEQQSRHAVLRDGAGNGATSAPRRCKAPASAGVTATAAVAISPASARMAAAAPVTAPGQSRAKTVKAAKSLGASIPPLSPASRAASSRSIRTTASSMGASFDGSAVSEKPSRSSKSRGSIRHVEPSGPPLRSPRLKAKPKSRMPLRATPQKKQ